MPRTAHLEARHDTIILLQNIRAADALYYGSSLTSIKYSPSTSFSTLHFALRALQLNYKI